MKPDSIINKLPPLKIHIDPLVIMIPFFPGKWIPMEVPSFIDKKQNTPTKLDSDQFSKKEGILLRTMEPEEFNSTQRAPYHDEGYGGLVNFHKLYRSKNVQIANFGCVLYGKV